MIYETHKIELDYSKINAPKIDYTPTLTLMIPNLEKEFEGNDNYAARPTVLILPGGGYAFRSDREAEPIAMHYLTHGFNCAVLYYSGAPAIFPVSLLETLTAIKFLRDNAQKYHVNKDKLYVCGFSAGGHLAASAGTLWNGKEAKDYFGNTDDLKPSGTILAYPVISSDFDGCTRIHKGSFNNLLGPDRMNDTDMLEYLCLDRRVTRDTSPTFIWSTFEDTCVPCESTLRFASALRKCGVPFEMHIYEKGGHGMATGDKVTNNAVFRAKDWLAESAAWIADNRSAYIDEIK